MIMEQKTKNVIETIIFFLKIQIEHANSLSIVYPCDVLKFTSNIFNHWLTVNYFTCFKIQKKPENLKTYNVIFHIIYSIQNRSKCFVIKIPKLNLFILNKKQPSWQQKQQFSRDNYYIPHNSNISAKLQCKERKTCW